MKKNKLISTLIQLGLLVVFAGGFVYLQKTQVAPTEVYVFSRDIPVNTVIQEGDLKKTYIPSDGVQSNFVVNKDEIVGKAVTTKVFAGQYVVSPQLINPEDTDPFEQIDLSNLRKITISVDVSSAIGGNIKKGDRVDLQFIGEGKSNGDNDKVIYTKTFLQDVLVYNVIDDSGKKYVDQTEGTSTIMNEDGEVVESGGIAVVTLAVTPEQADEIATRMTAGKINLVGRFDESTDGSSNGFTIGDYSKNPTSNSTPEN